jgi:uncharacterized protein (TIGR03086 family)
MPFEKSVLVPLGADETFALITEPDRLRRWQAVTARVDLRAGGNYRWTIIPGHSAAGTFIEVEPGRHVVFIWGWEGIDEVSTVTITLEPSAGGTMVRLVHEGLTAEQETSHAEGWNHYLGRLVEAAAHGDAGPDEWGAAPPELDAITSAEATLAICQRVLRGVPADDYGRPTVCPDFTVAQLAEHLIGSVTALGRAASADFPDVTVTALEPRLAGAAQPALEAWNARGLDGAVKLGPSELPATSAAGILSIEFLVHAWDFAQATGQQVTVSDSLAEHVLGIARTVITPEGRRRGAFADALPTGPDDNTMDRLIAYTGRAV